MANLNKTFGPAKLSNDDRYSISLYVEEKNKSIANNTSDVFYELTATKTKGDGYYSNDANSTVKVTIGGSEVENKKVKYNFQGSTPKTITLASGTVKDILHEPDGTKTIACNGYFKDGANSRGSATAKGNFTLSQLHKAPVPSITSYTELSAGLVNTFGIDNATYVSNASIKQYVVAAQPYDEANILSYKVSKNNVTTTISAPNTNAVLSFIDKPITDNVVNVEVTDDMGGVGKLVYSSGTFIPYTKPTLTASDLKAKRLGQVSGDVKLTANGTFYFGDVNNHSITPSVTYSIKDKATDTYISGYVDVPATVIQPQTPDGTWSIEETISTIFDPEHSYIVEVKVFDNLITAVNNSLPTGYAGMVIDTYVATVPLGQPTWVEYRDHVDFKRLTIQGVEVTPGGGGAGDYSNLINKPQINSVTLSGDKSASQLGFATVATSGSYNDLSNKPTIPTVNNATLTIQKNGTTVNTFTANASSNVTANISVPTKTSDLTNDSNFASDASYVHTDNNYTTTEKNKLSGIASGAEVNVQANWTETNTSSDAYIKNKPTIPTQTSQLTNNSNFVSDASYVHTDNNYTTTEKNKLSGIASGAEVNVQSDWNQTTTTADDYIKNKPTIPTVNNGTLTIQKNGTNVQTFTANQSSNATANITVPTQTSELTNNSGFITSSASITGNAATATNLKPVCVVGSDNANTNGWYKVASSTLSGYNNQNILYYIKSGYTNGYVGILDFEMRSDNTSIQCWKCQWLVRHPNVTEGSIKIVINGMTWTMYAYQPSVRYGRLYFVEMIHRNINGANPQWTITYYNSSTPEETTPTATTTSTDGFIVARAIGDKNGNDITTTYQPKLTAGTNITIDANNVISASGGGGGTATTVKINGTSITSNNEADIKTNGTYNASSNKIATMSDVPTNTNQLTNGAGFITKSVNNLDNYTLSSSLKAVATSGSYNDLTNKPTIPTVNNATLTIQKNGTSVGTFTANASSNVTANISVPTKLSDFETVLYNNASGTTGNVTLSETSANFSYIEVFYFTSDDQYCASVKVYSPNGKIVQLRGEIDNGTNDYLYYVNYTINGTTMTHGGEIRWLLRTNGYPTRSTTTTRIHIYRVIGYK